MLVLGEKLGLNARPRRGTDLFWTGLCSSSSRLYVCRRCWFLGINGVPTQVLPHLAAEEGGGGGNKPLSSGLKKSFPLTSPLTPLSPLSPAAAAPLPNPVSATSRPHLCMKCAYIESAQKKGGNGSRGSDTSNLTE